MHKSINKIRNIKLNKNQTFLSVFIIGVIVGSIFANFLKASQLKELGMINEYFFDKYVHITLNSTDLLKYILIKRIKLILFIWFFGLTFFGIPIIILSLLYFGFFIGFMISIGTIIYGINGMFLNISYLLPHFIIYVPIFIYLINKSFKLCAKLYYKKIYTRTYRFNNKQLFIEYILVLLVCLLGGTLGGLLETFINPNIVKICIQNFIYK